MTWRGTIFALFVAGLACLVVATYLEYGLVPGLAAAGGAFVTMAIVMSMNQPDPPRHF